MSDAAAREGGVPDGGWVFAYRVVCAERDAARAEVAALRQRVKTLTYASDDGTEYEHNDHDPHGGEPECPACWAASIRAALATGGDQ